MKRKNTWKKRVFKGFINVRVELPKRVKELTTIEFGNAPWTEQDRR